MTTRRELLLTLAATAATAAAVLVPHAAQAQTTAPRVIGVLTPIDQPGVKILIEGLRALGYEDGKNIRLVLRSAQGDYTRLPALARELVDAKAEILIAFNTPGSRAAINATKTIPIIMTSIGDPVGSGLVASLARPGGNVTGLSNMVGELGPKRLALLHELVPGAKRIAVLYNPADPVNDPQIRDMTQAAPKLGVEVRFYPVKTPANLDETFTTLLAWRARAVIWLGGQALPYQAGSIKLAARHKLPMMSAARIDVEAGGLMSYGAESAAMFRRTAAYADKILKGTPVGQLPVEQPTIFDLALNLKAAKALGLKVPQGILIQATTVIE